MNDSLNKAVWPGWETVREIGKGSFGAVYEIQKDVLGMTDKAALKVITIPKDKSDIEELYSDGYDEKSITERYKNFLEDIVREYKMMAELKGNHNIVYCDDIRYIQHDDGFGWDIYIKMELLTPLTKAIKTSVDDRQVVKLGMDICNALKACEKKNIIHRDIKPQNIFVSSEGDYKLGDFGIAKTAEHISTGTKTGTFKYMAPEVYNNHPYGSSCDIYSLGMVLYWLLNERRIPFLPLPPSVPTATEDNDALLRRMSGEGIPAPIHGSEELKQIVLKACDSNPAQRFATASEMYEALAALSEVNASTNFSDFDNIEDIFKDEEEATDETIGVFGRSKPSNTKYEDSVRFEEIHKKEEEPQANSWDDNTKCEDMRYNSENNLQEDKMQGEYYSDAKRTVDYDAQMNSTVLSANTREHSAIEKKSFTVIWIMRIIGALGTIGYGCIAQKYEFLAIAIILLGILVWGDDKKKHSPRSYKIVNCIFGPILFVTLLDFFSAIGMDLVGLMVDLNGGNYSSDMDLIPLGLWLVYSIVYIIFSFRYVKNR